MDRILGILLLGLAGASGVILGLMKGQELTVNNQWCPVRIERKDLDRVTWDRIIERLNDDDEVRYLSQSMFEIVAPIADEERRGK